MEKPFYKTKLTLEVEVDTQFGPIDAIGLAYTALNCTAVKGITVTNLETDYVPLTEQDANHKVMTGFPQKLK